jgi:hypothetical protein
MTAAAVELGHKNGDVVSGFELLGKAFEGNTTALKKQGIEIEAGLSKQERMARVVEVVNQKLGGQAEAAAKGTNQFKILHAVVSDLSEAIGENFAPDVQSGTSELIKFLTTVKDNKAAVGFIADNIKMGIAVAGLVTVTSAGALGFLRLQRAVEASAFAMQVFGTSTRAALITSGIGIALVALTEGFIYFANKSASETKKATKEVRDHGAEIRKLADDIKRLEAEQPDLRKLEGFRLEMYERGKAARLKAMKESLKNEEAAQKEFDDLQTKAQEAKKAKGVEDAKDQRKVAAQRAHNEALLLEASAASSSLVSIANQQAQLLDQIAQDENAKIRDHLRERYAELRIVRVEEEAIDAEQRRLFKEQFLVQSQEFQLLDEEQKRVFKLKEEEGLRSQILTERTARSAAAKAKLEEEIKTNNTFLLERQKYGVAVATIDKVMNSEQMAAAKSISGELVALAQSKNATLKAIGKAAAISSIVINTAASAVTLTKQIQDVIPFPFSIPVIAALVGARIAFGAEQVATVQGAAKGALVEGGIPGRDSVPFFLEPGELVVPKRNFEEVVGGVQLQRSIVGDAGGAAGSPIVSLLASIDEKIGNLRQEVYQFNADVWGDADFLSAFLEKINRQVQFFNAQLVASKVRA